MHSLPSTFKGQTSLARPLAAAEPVKSETIVVLDLRGIEHGSEPTGGLRQENAGGDIRAVVTAFGRDRASALSHGIGVMVA